MSPLNNSDLLTSLPLELTTTILQYLSPADLQRISHVRKSWRLLTFHPHIYASHLSARISRSSPQTLLSAYKTYSATSYFTSHTLRELALRLLALQTRWASGVPARKVVLLRNGAAAAVGAVVVVDRVGGGVVTGDKVGNVRFWNVVAGRREAAALNFSGGVTAMALEREWLVVGTTDNTVHLLHRHARSFKRTRSTAVSSLVLSLSLTARTCIAACKGGSIHILSLRSGKEELLQIHLPAHHRALGQQNTSIHYLRPFLFTTSSSSVVSQISPKCVDADNAREIWEYGEDELKIKNYSSGGEGVGACLVAPFRERELLVAWPGAGVCAMGGFRSSVIALPDCCGILPPAEGMGGVRKMVAGAEAFVVADGDTIKVYSHSGTLIATFCTGGSEVTALAMDPCFFVSAAEDGDVVVWDFTPPPPPPPSADSGVEGEGEDSGEEDGTDTPPSSPEPSLDGGKEGEGRAGFSPFIVISPVGLTGPCIMSHPTYNLSISPAVINQQTCVK